MQAQLLRVVSFLRRGWAWSLCLTLSAALFVWFAGPLFAVAEHRVWESAASRLVTISALFLVWGLSVVYREWRSGQKKKTQEDDADAQERIRREEMMVEQQVELQTRYNAALRTLNRSSLYKGRSERWRRELPWYLLIGPEGSGKTSLLDFSGIDFPLNHEASRRMTRDVTPTRHADWYFADHAVLLDTAGRYLTQDDAEVDSVAWHSLLDLLRRRRPRPLNGVLVDVSVETLQSSSEQALEQLARQVRQRLHDVNQRLGVEAPVYLVLSKADRIIGFDEFFDQLSREESEQVLGASFREGVETIDSQLVHNEFEQLLRRLNSQVIMRVHQERDSLRRGRILDFPHQLGQIGERLCLFTELTFTGNRYQRASRLRGFYLTSAPELQHGLDPLTASIGRSLGPDTSALPAYRNGTARFIKNLLTEVIFPEADLAGLDQREAKRITWQQRTAYAAALACLAVFGLTWATSFSYNTGRLEQLREVGRLHAHLTDTVAPNDPLLERLALLNASYRATQQFPTRQDARWRERGGLYQGERVTPVVAQQYRRDLEEQLLTGIAHQMEERISRSLDDRNGLLVNIRAYLMLSLSERRDDRFLQAWAAQEWSRRYEGDSETQQALNDHFARLLAADLTLVTPDAQLIAEARQQLRSEPLASVVYRMLKEQARELPDYRLEQHLGPEAALLTSSHNVIPGFYTRDGYQRIFVTHGHELISAILKDNWVLGGSDTLSAADLKQLTSEMEQLYFSDYASHWSDALAMLHLEPLADAAQGSVQLARLTASNSPILQLLKQVRLNTRLRDLVVADPAVIAGATIQTEHAQKALERQFEPLHRLVNEDQTPSPELFASLQALDTLQQQLTVLAQSSAPRQAAFEMAKARMEGQRDAINLLKAQAQQLPEPVAHWFGALAQDSWMLMLSDAHEYLNERYRSELYAAYRAALHERYPFNASSESDVTLSDFREFFRTQGTADQFYERYLRSFLSDAGGNYKLRQLDGRALPMSRSFLAQLARMHTIRQGFFAEDAAEPQIAFKLEPHSLDSSLGRASFRFGDRTLEYRHGPIVQTAFRWPAATDDGLASLSVEDMGGRRASLEQKTGPWALFRMLDQLEVAHHVERDALMLRANLSGMRANYLLHSQRSPNPFDATTLRSFNLPARL